VNYEVKNNLLDLLPSPISQIINLPYLLCRLADRGSWGCFEGERSLVYGKGCGQPVLSTRLLAGLPYLKHTFEQNGEDVIDRWIKIPYWQHFCGVSQLDY